MKRLGLVLLVAAGALALPLSAVNKVHAYAPGPPGFGALISAINHTGEEATLVSSIRAGPPADVTLVDASSLLKANNVHALDNAIARNLSSINLLQQSLGSLVVHPPDPCVVASDGGGNSCSMSFGEFLSSHNIASSDIVAATLGNTGSDGSASITVFFYHPPNPCTQTCPGS